METVRLYHRGYLGRHKKVVVGYSEPLLDGTFKDAGLKMNSKWLLHKDSLDIHPSSSGTLQLHIIALSIRTTKLLSKAHAAILAWSIILCSLQNIFCISQPSPVKSHALAVGDNMLHGCTD